MKGQNHTKHATRKGPHKCSEYTHKLKSSSNDLIRSDFVHVSSALFACCFTIGNLESVSMRKSPLVDSTSSSSLNPSLPKRFTSLKWADNIFSLAFMNLRICLRLVEKKSDATSDTMLPKLTAASLICSKAINPKSIVCLITSSSWAHDLHCSGLKVRICCV